MEKRVIFSDNGTLIDLTTQLGKYASGEATLDYVAGEDSLFIGSYMPFNHLYFKLKTPNTSNVSMTVKYWSVNQFVNAVEVRDDTKGLTQSGFMRFTPNRQTRWERESTNDQSEMIPPLLGVVIYDHYWIQVDFNSSLDVGTELSWIGNLFSTDEDLVSEFPDFGKSTVKTSYQAGKTTWEEQHVRAAEILAQDLIDKGVIFETGQILERKDYINASVQKTAELIYNAFGDDFVDQRLRAKEEYERRLNKRIHRVDTNADAITQIEEIRNESGWLSR